MSQNLEIPLTELLADLVIPAAALAMATAQLAAATGTAALRGWRDLLAALRDQTTAPAEPGADVVPMRAIGTPIRDAAILDQALAAEGLRAIAPSAGDDPTRVILDRAGRPALTLHLAPEGGTAFLIDAAGVAAVRDEALRHDLIARLCGDPERVLDRLTRRYAAIAVAATLREAGMAVTEEAGGTVRATARDRATGGTRTVIFDAFSEVPARARTRHRGAGGGGAPCSAADAAAVRAALRRPERPGGAGAAKAPGGAGAALPDPARRGIVARRQTT